MTTRRLKQPSITIVQLHASLLGAMAVLGACASSPAPAPPSGPVMVVPVIHDPLSAALEHESGAATAAAEITSSPEQAIDTPPGDEQAAGSEDKRRRRGTAKERRRQ